MPNRTDQTDPGPDQQAAAHAAAKRRLLDLADRMHGQPDPAARGGRR